MGFIEKITGLMNGEASQQEGVEVPGTPEDGAPPAEAALSAEGETGQGDPEETKAYTPDEVERLLEDRKKQWQEEMKAEEQERLSNLSETDRLKQEQLSKEAEIARLQAELSKRDLQTEVFAKLEEMKLPTGIEKLVQYGDKESTMKSLQDITGIFNQAVQDGVTLRLRGATPKGLHHEPAFVREAMQKFGDPFERAFSKEIGR